jgi:hypothetical protein
MQLYMVRVVQKMQLAEMKINTKYTWHILALTLL